MPRPFRAAAICRSVFAPTAWASLTAGATLSANVLAPAEWFALAIARAFASLGLPSACPRALAAARAANVRSLINLALALGEGRVQVQHERLDVRAQLRDDEWDPMGHQAGNEMDVSAEAIERGNRDGAFTVPAGLGVAAASCGRRSIASAPLPVSISTNSPTTS
jgi:hypothetical protein